MNRTAKPAPCPVISFTSAKAAKSAFEVSQLIEASNRVNALYVIKEELELLKDEIRAANVADLEVRIHFRK